MTSIVITPKMFFDKKKRCPIRILNFYLNLFKIYLNLKYYEDEIEEWFKSGPDSAPADQRKPFYPEICVKVSKACCESETQFGKNCKECPTGINGEVCHGRGKCEGGGDRNGKGTCKCDLGYTGKLCDTCATEKYFLKTEPSDTEKPECTRCFTGCKVSFS